ncbi:MAG TPA: RagB/SusD family nutrient uptake outer membrane protein [Chitinophagaceae bacterium]|nr:RagB/SusD family nutrient uptake outer membrane protein [Chitinophagaceae bacterium]
MNPRFFNSLAIVLSLLFLMVAGGCKKYLDQQPKTELGPAQVFSDVPNTYKAIAGVYSRLVGDQGYGIRLSLYYTVDNDEMQGPTGNGDNDRRDIARYAATSGNAQLERPFNQIFQGIEYANICIDNIPKMDMYSNGSDQEKKQLQRMYGEALTLRAQFYLEAIRNWGDLPKHFEPAYSLAVTDQYPSKVDRDSLYKRLLDDLATAATLVPWRNEVTAIGDQADERITKGTVKALRARIALFRGGYSLRQNGQMQRGSDYQTYYQIAKDECNDIINSGQHTLNPSYKALWKDQVCAHAVTDPEGELMFQASAIGLSGAEDTKLGYYNGPRVNNRGNSSYNPLPSYFYLFDSTDLRRDVTITPYFSGADGITKIGQASSNMTDGKYRRDWITNPSFSPNDAVQYFSLKWQIIRYSDVLLMYAEAENELNGPTASAYNAINMVRRRGYGKAIGTADPTVDIPSGLSKTEFFKYLVRERALELGGEGVRKYDLIRWNLIETALNESRANLVRLSTNTPVVNPTYMAGYPTYSISNTLPIYMYYNQNSTADDYTLWRNSFYKPAPGSTPSGTTRVNWINAAINTTCAARYATGFTAGKTELLPFPNPALGGNPNLVQNPGY